MINILPMNYFKQILPFVLLTAVMISGCVVPQRTSKAEMDDMHLEPRIRPGLTIDIVVMVAGTREVEEISKRVTANGTISLPLLGDVSAVPLTLKELRTVLEKRFAEYFVEPKVTVEFSQDLGPGGISPWGSVTVMGRVVKPGKVNIPPTRDLTVSRAIQQAGGFSSSANESNIRITRRLRDGKTETLKVDLKAMASGAIDQDIVLYPGDVIFVPERIL